MNKLLKNKKALSPVVAAIILIAVTVAVSIAVAAWMGSMTFGFMATEQITITKVEFLPSGAVNNVTRVTVLNTGTTDVILSSATVTGFGVITVSLDNSPVTIGESLTVPFNVTITSGTWTAGSTYTVELLSSKGNKFAYTDTA